MELAVGSLRSLLVLSLLISSGVHAMEFKTIESPFLKSSSSLGPSPQINNMTPAEARAATIVPEFSGQTVYSGFVEINPETGSSMYFIYYSALNQKSDAPLIVWIEGGPGCSSWGSNLGFVGPYGLQDDGKQGINLVPRDTTWNNDFDILFVDNPLGTGFSYIGSKSDYVTNEEEMSINFNTVLQTFMATYPEYQSKEIYMMGHSYAGHYAPPLATFIMKQNENIAKGLDQHSITLNLKALALGDAFVNIGVQIGYFGEIAYSRGFIDQTQREYIEKLQVEGQKQADAGQADDAQATFWKILNYLTDNFGVNPYFMGPAGGFPNYDSQFLNNATVKEQLHIPSELTYVGCNGTVGDYMTVDEGRSYQMDLPQLLETMPVLFYTGLDDLLVNHLGNEELISTTKWSGAADFTKTQRVAWKNNSGDFAGYQKVSGNVMQVFILNAGHVSAQYQQQNAREMVTNFHNFVKEFYGTEQQDF